MGSTTVVELHLDVAVRNHRYVDGVACVAGHVEESLRPRLKKAGFSGLLESVHNGAKFPARPAHKVCRVPLRLLYMGSMDPFKGVFDLVPILQSVSRLGVPVELIIAGGHNDDLARRFKQKRLNSLVTWLGRVPHEECYRLAEQSDVLLMLSRKEAFGMVTIEAMAMGCVPLANDIAAGSREIIENGTSGLLLPLGDFAAWAQAIMLLHDDQVVWRRLSGGAMDRARRDFNAEVMSHRLCAFLTRVREHAVTFPSERTSGAPVEAASMPRPPRSRYQRLPPSLRRWLRNWIGARPKLSYWLLKRW